MSTTPIESPVAWLDGGVNLDQLSVAEREALQAEVEAIEAEQDGGTGH